MLNCTLKTSSVRPTLSFCHHYKLSRLDAGVCLKKGMHNASVADFNRAYMYPAIVLSILLAVVGLIGNTVLLVASLINKSLHTKSARLIMLLCIADLSSCIGFIQVEQVLWPSHMRYVQESIMDALGLYYHFTMRECMWVITFKKVSHSLDMDLILVLGIDRLLSLLFPVW